MSSRPMKWAAVAAVVSFVASAACKSEDQDQDDAVVADAGTRDGSVREVEPLEILSDCDADAGSIYMAPADLATADVERRGEVVRCTTGMLIDVEVLREAFAAGGYAGLELTTSVRSYRIQYRTERLAGAASVATALVFVPVEPAASPSPLVLFAHGHADLGQPAFSSLPIGETPYANALALAAHGYPVIAVDYTGYVEKATPPAPTLAEDEAHSILDATRALVSLFPEGSTNGEWVFVGHSQGGHAVLSAQSFAGAYGLGGTLRAVVPLTPGWAPIRSLPYLLSKERDLNTTDDPWWIWAASEYLVSHAQVYGDGEAAVAAMFQPGKLATLNGLTKVEDFLMLGRTAYDFFDHAFLDALMACAATGRDEDCASEVGKTWQPRMRADRPTLDPEGAEVLAFVAGRDTASPPAYMRCGLDKIRADLAGSDVPFHVCTDPEAEHGPIITRQLGWITRWLDSRLLGRSEPEACLGEEALGQKFLETECLPGNLD